MYTVYVLKSKDYPKSYVGYSKDIERRLKDHNAGKVAYTSKYKPWSLVYREEFETGLEAKKKEVYLKSGAGRRWMKGLFK